MCLTFYMWNICEVIYKWDTYVYHILVHNMRQNNTVYIEYFFTSLC